MRTESRATADTCYKALIGKQRHHKTLHNTYAVPLDDTFNIQNVSNYMRKRLGMIYSEHAPIILRQQYVRGNRFLWPLHGST